MAWWRRWIGRRESPAEAARTAWRQTWTAAIAQPDADAVARLRSALATLALPDEEIELESEMLDGFAAVVELGSLIAASGLPLVETGHRVIGAESCHFSAPVFVPDDSSQAGGRLLFTPTRAVFAGGAKPTSLPWHAVTDVQQTSRDILFVRADRERVYRFRANSYADALCGALIAQRLLPRRQKDG